MLRLTKFCLFSFIVAIIEITWSAFDLAEESVIFLSGSEEVGKFFVKQDKNLLIALTEKEETLVSKSTNYTYWWLLLLIIVINFVWVIASFKLLYGILKVIFTEDRLKALKCCRLWCKFSWLLLVIFAIKLIRDAAGFTGFVYACGVVVYRVITMYIVYVFAKELEIAEFIEPNLDLLGGVASTKPSTSTRLPPAATTTGGATTGGFHVNPQATIGVVKGPSAAATVKDIGQPPEPPPVTQQPREGAGGGATGSSTNPFRAALGEMPPTRLEMQTMEIHPL